MLIKCHEHDNPPHISLKQPKRRDGESRSREVVQINHFRCNYAFPAWIDCCVEWVSIKPSNRVNRNSVQCGRCDRRWLTKIWTTINHREIDFLPAFVVFSGCAKVKMEQIRHRKLVIECNFSLTGDGKMNVLREFEMTEKCAWRTELQGRVFSVGSMHFGQDCWILRVLGISKISL